MLLYTPQGTMEKDIKRWIWIHFRGSGWKAVLVGPVYRLKIHDLREVGGFIASSRSYLAMRHILCSDPSQIGPSIYIGSYPSPLNPYGNWNETMLVNEDLVQDINLHLQELGKDITAAKVVLFLACPDIKEKHG